MDLLNKLKQFKPNVKEITLQRYIQNMNKLNKDFDNSEMTYLGRPDLVLEHLQKNYSENTEKAILNSIVVAIQAMGKYQDKLDEYVKRRDELNKKYFDSKSTNLKNDKEEKNMVSTEDILKLLDELNKNIVDKKLRTKKNLTPDEKELLTEYLVIKFYSEYPLRNDLAQLHVANSKTKLDADKNYLIMMNKGARLVLNNFKTNKKYGSKTINLSNDMFKLLRNYLKRNEDDQYLLYNKNGTVMSKNQLSFFLIKTFEKYLGKRIGTQMLRKIFLSSKYGDTLSQMKADSDMMGHSVATQQGIYTKIN